MRSTRTCSSRRPSRAPARKFAISQTGEPSYKRLTRTIAVPAGGATAVLLDHPRHRARTGTSSSSRPVPPAPRTGPPCRTNGHTAPEHRPSAPTGPNLHPFLAHYQTGTATGPLRRRAAPAVAGGERRRARARSSGGRPLRLRRRESKSRSATRATTSIRFAGVVRRRHRGLHGRGQHVLRGRRRRPGRLGGPGRPTGSPANPNNWIVGTGRTRRRRSARRRGIVRPTAGDHRIPRRDFGRIRSRPPAGSWTTRGLGFALENQTRPVYSQGFFDDPGCGDTVVVHELAHQWYGDSLAVARWQHIWLNEGFATYAEWLWSDTRASAPSRRTSILATDSPTITRSGRWSSAIPGPTTCSTSRSTRAAP